MKDNTRRIFVCPLLPETVVKKYSLSWAANNFCNNLIAGGMFDTILTYLSPIIDHYAEINQVQDNHLTIYHRKTRKTRIGRKLAFIGENLKTFKLLKSGDSIWFYNLPYTVLPLFWLLKILKPKTRLYLILLDYTPLEKGFKNLYKSFELFCFKQFQGLITLSDFDALKNKNKNCIPGVVPNVNPKWPVVSRITRDFLISGSLGYNISMIPSLLEAFAKMDNVVLHITGRIPDKALLEKYSSCRNIVYHGEVDYSEYLEILHRCPFLLSTRNPKALENQCNFPSKIIEGLLHNRIIVSTIDYPQLGSIKYFKVDADNLEKDLKDIAEMQDYELLHYSNQSELTHSMYNASRWTEEMENIEKYKV